MRRVVTACAAVAALTASASTRADGWALELEAVPSYGGIWSRATARPGEVVTQNGGVGAALAVTLRSRYFLAPFVSVGYRPLMTGVSVAPDGAYAHSRATAVPIAFGPALDLWRLRLYGGLSPTWVQVRSKLGDETIAPSEVLLGYGLGLAGRVLERRRFRLGVGLEALILSEASMVSLAGGLRLGLDPLVW